MIAYKDISPAPIENTVMTQVIRDGMHMVTRICPKAGFALHDKAGQWEDPDTQARFDAYYTGTCSCGADYDFAENPRQFYAVKAETVPNNQIFG